MAVNMNVKYVGLNLRSPFLAAAAGITGSIPTLVEAERAGIGGVVLKSYFEKEVCRRSPTPRFSLLHSGHGKIKAKTLYSYEQASEFDLAGYVDFIETARNKISIPIIASINCFTEQGWIEAARAVEAAGADAIELNLSCPHGVHLMEGRDLIDEMSRSTSRVREVVKIPIIPKLTPQVASPLKLALAVEKQGADGIVAFNRFTGLDLDLDNLRPIMHGSYAGHGGPWSIYYNLRWISQIYPQVKIPISASGGVWSGLDAAKYLLLGASTVQVCSAIILEGFGVIQRLERELRSFMEEKGFESIEQIRGAANRVLTMEEVNREQRVVATVKKDSCTGCGACSRVCIYNAISMEDGKAEISNSCQGCGLCREVCPTGAIELVEVANKDERD